MDDKDKPAIRKAIPPSLDQKENAEKLEGYIWNKMIKSFAAQVVEPFLQTDYAGEEGYIPLHVLQESTPGQAICKRCFRIQHYNDDPAKEPVISQEFFKIIHDAKKSKSLVVYVIDVFNFEASFNREINEALSGLDVILVANKVDLLPKSTNRERLEEFVLERAKAAKLKVRHVLSVSSTKNISTDDLLKVILDNYNDRNVFFIGAVSSGKSSLIKALLRNFKK